MVTRLSGLASGLDTETMVQDLMKAQRIPLDTLYQKQTQLEWKKEDYAEIYTAVQDFRNTVFTYKLSNTLSPRSVSSTDESIATATASGDTADIGHSLVVSKLAQGATNVSQTDMAVYKSTMAAQFGIENTDIVLNGTTISVDSSQSMYDLVSSINSADVGVKANYDATINRLFLYSSTTGSDAEIDFTGTDATGLAFLKDNLNLAQDGETGNLLLSTQGQDAAFTLDGIALTQTTNSFGIAGVNYQLKGAGSATIAVSTDMDQAVENVKSFIEDYNALLAKVNDKLSETRDKDYMPLMDTQKTDMNESDIELWESKARSGLLRNDSILRGVVLDLRNSMAGIVGGLSGNYSSASTVGITTGDYSENGKIYLNEDKLKAALQADPDVLNKLFATDADDDANSGIAQRIYDDLANAMTKLTSEAGGTLSIGIDTKSTIAKQLADYDDRIDTLVDRLATMEERYYAQYDAMETALNKLNQQSSWLTQQFSSGQ